MKKLLSIIGLSVLLCASCTEDEVPSIEAEGKATLSLDAVFGTQDFALNKDFTASGKSFNFWHF